MGFSRHRPRSRLDPGFLPWLLCLVSLTASFTQAAGEQVSEHQVKAAFLLNFTKFVEWPQAAFGDQRSPIAICVLGEDPIGGALDQLVEGEVVDGRRVVVRRLKEPPASKQCQVLFVSPAIKDVSQMLSALGSGILTVSEDSDRFLRDGGVISFVIENRHVRFDINQSAAESEGLKLSSRLLRVARSVEK
jgi:hypothetical protein